MGQFSQDEHFLSAAKPPVYKSPFSPIIIIIIISIIISFYATLLFAGRKHTLMVEPIPMVDPLPMLDPMPMVDPIPMSAIPIVHGTIDFDAGL